MKEAENTPNFLENADAINRVKKPIALYTKLIATENSYKQCFAQFWKQKVNLQDLIPEFMSEKM